MVFSVSTFDMWIALAIVIFLAVITLNIAHSRSVRRAEKENYDRQMSNLPDNVQRALRLLQRQHSYTFVILLRDELNFPDGYAMSPEGFDFIMRCVSNSQSGTSAYYDIENRLIPYLKNYIRGHNA